MDFLYLCLEVEQSDNGILASVPFFDRGTLPKQAFLIRSPYLVTKTSLIHISKG